jgi:serine phosphatase RsbU (regulator of sigma subunit)
VPQILEAAGYPIGVVPKPEYREVELELRKGDRLFICSDGILEAEDPDRNHFGHSGLSAVLDAARDRTLDEAVMAVGARLEVWCAGRGLSDDASMVALEVLPDGRQERG